MTTSKSIYAIAYRISVISTSMCVEETWPEMIDAPTKPLGTEA